MIKTLFIIVCLFPNIMLSQSVLSMEQEEGNGSSSVRAKSVHNFQYADDSCVLRSPKTEEEWESYHAIRIAQIHERYCQGYKYKYSQPEEGFKDNFRFVLVDQSLGESQVVGVIRVDLLAGNEAALRWVAIHGESQRKGFGKRMLILAETFAKEQKRTLIRIPAEEDSRKFYEKLGYLPATWPGGPENSGNVPLSKQLVFR